MNIPTTSRRKSVGLAAVEFALILPILLILVLGVFDFSRALRTQLIVINVSREGANLAARSPSLESRHQDIMNSLTASTPPLDMPDNGMIYITEIMGYSQGGVVRNIITAQYRWTGGNTTQGSRIWTCNSWNGDGSCRNIPSGNNAPTANVMTNDLAAGDLIYAVEVFYDFETLFSGTEVGFGLSIPQIGPTLSSMTVL